MHGGFLLKAVLFLLLSHAVILICVYEYPGIVQQLEAFLPVNATLSAAMTAVASLRPAFLTRSLLLSNPNTRAGNSLSLRYSPCLLRRDRYPIKRSTQPRSLSRCFEINAFLSSGFRHHGSYEHPTYLPAYRGFIEWEGEEVPPGFKYL